MKILVVGSGAREHALCWRLSRDPAVDRVLCAPGNAGLATQFDTAPVDPADPRALLALAAREGIDLTVVGPEAPLERGVVDLFTSRDRLIFGPTRRAAQLETSKAFAKSFMGRHGVPTARSQICSTADGAVEAIRSGEFGESVVVKADGLAAGKGVIVAEDAREAESAVRAMMVERAFGDAGRTVVLEERLQGPELSFFVIASGTESIPLVAAQDHKRVFDDDRGPNTGGMGAFAPTPLLDDALRQTILRTIVQPVLSGMIAEGMPYSGFLYCGLMVTSAGPKVIEFNVRFGDPEAQVVLPLVAEPLAPVLSAAAAGTLRSREIIVSRDPHVGVVLAANGYPGEVRAGQRIQGLDRVVAECPDVQVFHAGVKRQDAALVAGGGRVLTVVAHGPTFPAAIDRVYDAVSRIRFEGMQYRRDIGRKAIA
jgi:phosphoribosylamine--glycine ligase